MYFYIAIAVVVIAVVFGAVYAIKRNQKINQNGI